MTKLSIDVLQTPYFSPGGIHTYVSKLYNFIRVCRAVLNLTGH